MTLSNRQIESITQDVLRQLRTSGVSVVASVPVSQYRAEDSADAPEAEVPLPGRSDVLSLDAKVVTEAELVAVQAAGRIVRHPAGAVITPSGRDYIRKNDVTLTTADESRAATGKGRLLTIGECASATSAATAASWIAVAAGCEFDAASKAAQYVPDPVVCCGGEPSLAACLLNRDSRIRAAVIGPSTDAHRLKHLMNPQVVCLETAGWSFAALLRLFRQLGDQSGAAPKSWKELR